MNTSKVNLMAPVVREVALFSWFGPFFVTLT